MLLSSLLALVVTVLGWNAFGKVQQQDKLDVSELLSTNYIPSVFLVSLRYNAGVFSYCAAGQCPFIVQFFFVPNIVFLLHGSGTQWWFMYPPSIGHH